MILSKPLDICIVLGCLVHSVFSKGAYEINMNGQTFQVNLLNPDGETYHDRTKFTDDYGDLLDTQKNAICSSLRAEQCEQVTNNGAKTHNLFNYFPNHASESAVAHANSKFNKDPSPHLWKQPMDDRSLKYLSHQNPHILGTKPITQRLHGVTQTLLNEFGLGSTINGALDSLQRVGTKKIKHKRRNRKKHKKPTSSTETSNEDMATKPETAESAETEGNTVNEEEYDDVEIQLYSNLGQDEDLANALGLDEEEFGETVDRIVAQLVASYLDNDSEEVDVTQIFANEMSVENGDVSMEELVLDDVSMEEINKLLNNIAEKHKKKKNDGEDEIEGDMNEQEEAQIFALKFMIDSDETMEDDGESQVENDDESEQKLS